MTPDCSPIIQPNTHRANRIVHRMSRQPLARGPAAVLRMRGSFGMLWFQ